MPSRAAFGQVAGVLLLCLVLSATFTESEGLRARAVSSSKGLPHWHPFAYIKAKAQAVEHAVENDIINAAINEAVKAANSFTDMMPAKMVAQADAAFAELKTQAANAESNYSRQLAAAMAAEAKAEGDDGGHAATAKQKFDEALQDQHWEDVLMGPMAMAIAISMNETPDPDKIKQMQDIMGRVIEAVRKTVSSLPPARGADVTPAGHGSAAIKQHGDAAPAPAASGSAHHSGGKSSHKHKEELEELNAVQDELSELGEGAGDKPSLAPLLSGLRGQLDEVRQELELSSDATSVKYIACSGTKVPAAASDQVVQEELTCTKAGTTDQVVADINGNKYDQTLSVVQSKGKVSVPDDMKAADNEQGIKILMYDASPDVNAPPPTGVRDMVKMRDTPVLKKEAAIKYLQDGGAAPAASAPAGDGDSDKKDDGDAK